LLLVPIIGIEVKGSKRWLDFFFLPRFQPIELLKPFIIIAVAAVLCSKKYHNIYNKYFLSLVLILPILFLLITQPDIGQTLLVFLTWLSLVFTSGINLVIFFLFFGAMIFFLLYLIFFVSKFNYHFNKIKIIF
jgi:Bacterial cell division membrane protein